MKRIDKTGAYCFSDAHVGQTNLFTFTDPTDAARIMARELAGATLGYDEVEAYALNESPFPNPKSMLKVLEKEDLTAVGSADKPRRKFTYPDELHDILRIHFKTNGKKNDN